MNPDLWKNLRKLTAARIGLGRTGGSATTESVLQFRLDHARARDAVLAPFSDAALATALGAGGHPVVTVQSRASTRAHFLLRPNDGRRLDPESVPILAAHRGEWDVAMIVSDGLSALAAERQGPGVCAALLPLLHGAGWRVAPIVVARFGRVALQDEIGGLLGARLALMLLGERPGLGSPDSLGAYFTYGPAVGKNDAMRNCVSNIRPEGLDPAAAAHKLFALIRESLRLELSGVDLKDETPLLDEPRRAGALPTSG